jgi:DNA sulfur modification protein DndC
MRIQKAALDLSLPIETHKVKPEINNTFWTSIIGKGYPSPRQKFRWCTDRMKIEPANRFILDKVSRFGEVVIVLGVRDSESATRSQVMDNHTVTGKTLMKHSTLTNAYVFAPIRDFSVDDVWEYLLSEPSPWGNDNHELVALYQNSQGSECPLIVDKEIKETAGSCGNSRFGCWVCTVVTQDKSVRGFIESGEKWLTPLLKFRNWLQEIRDVREYREKRRIDGSIYFIGQGDERELGPGPFTLEARHMILKKLLETQKQVQNPYDPNYKLILDEELKAIRKIWIESGDWNDSLPRIYNEIMGEDLNWEQDERPFFSLNQMTDLDLLCQKYGISIELVKRLVQIEKTYSGYRVRRGVFRDIEKLLNQDWLHYGEVDGYKQ